MRTINHDRLLAVRNNLKRFAVTAVLKFEKNHLLTCAVWLSTIGIMLFIVALVMDLYMKEYVEFLSDFALGIGLGLFGYSSLLERRQRKAKPWAFYVRDNKQKNSEYVTGRLFLNIGEAKAYLLNQSLRDCEIDGSTYKADEIFPLYLGVSRPADDLGDWEKS